VCKGCSRPRERYCNQVCSNRGAECNNKHPRHKTKVLREKQRIQEFAKTFDIAHYKKTHFSYIFPGRREPEYLIDIAISDNPSDQDYFRSICQSTSRNAFTAIWMSQAEEINEAIRNTVVHKYDLRGGAMRRSRK
jgi:hypothetical protein